MGAELVKIASVQYAHLPGAQFKVLIRMCVMALDKPNSKDDPARLYFGGWEPLALALGRKVPPPGPEPMTRRERKRLSDEVTKVCGQLCKAGAIHRRVEHPQTGERQEYALFPDPPTGWTNHPASPPPTGWTISPASDPPTATDRLDESPSLRLDVLSSQEAGENDRDRLGNLSSPRSTRGTTEDLREDTHGSVGDQPQGALDVSEEPANRDDTKTRAELLAETRRRLRETRRGPARP